MTSARRLCLNRRRAGAPRAHVERPRTGRAGLARRTGLCPHWAAPRGPWRGEARHVLRLPAPEVRVVAVAAAAAEEEEEEGEEAEEAEEAEEEEAD